MIRQHIRILMAAVAVFAATAVSSSAQPATTPLPVLDVPYLPQSEELCGGAAAAMVMRYWGATGVYAESFADLVDRAAGGIRGGDLIRRMEETGWQAHAVAGDVVLIAAQLRQRRPPIVLIEDRPGRFHYVVIVALTADRVVLHDPARAPFRVMENRRFLEAWRASNNWLLIALPGARPAEAAPPAAVDETAQSGKVGACSGMVEEGVRLARGGDLEDARVLLELAAERCPDDPAGPRELAGIHAVGKDWPRAAEQARRALDRDRGDAHAAQILATASYLEGRRADALDAWNLIGEPTIDLVDIRGLDRTRFRAASGLLALEPRAQLTSSGLARAARRLDLLPSAAASRVTYTPAASGLAQVTASVVERPLFPASRSALAIEAARAAIDREVRVNVASPSGGGELVHAAWRWWEARPRVSTGIAFPSRIGVWRLEGAHERQTYGPPGGEMAERRRRLEVAVSDWATGTIGWGAGVAVERREGETGMSAFGTARYHTVGDRVRLDGDGSLWSGSRRSWTIGARVEARTRAEAAGTVVIGRAGASAAGADAPLAYWPGAGTGQGRRELLRAHPLLDDGVIRGGAFGRGLLHAGVEWRFWSSRPLLKVLRWAPAAFADAARPIDAPSFADPRAHLDAGLGLRLSVPGAGVLRVDVGRGLRDGAMAISAGWTR